MDRLWHQIQLSRLILCFGKNIVILDSLHRLMKQAIEGKTIVQVRKIPERDITNILKDR